MKFEIIKVKPRLIAGTAIYCRLNDRRANQSNQGNPGHSWKNSKVVSGKNE